MSTTTVLQETAELAPVVGRTAEEPAEAWEVTEILLMGRSAIDSTLSLVPEINWKGNSSSDMLEGEIIMGLTLGLIHLDPAINCASMLFCYDSEDDQNYREYLLMTHSLGSLMRAISDRVKQEFATAV